MCDGGGEEGVCEGGGGCGSVSDTDRILKFIQQQKGMCVCV